MWEREAPDLSPLVKEHGERRGTNSGHKAAPFLEGLSCCSDASSSGGGEARGGASQRVLVGATRVAVERENGCAARCTLRFGGREGDRAGYANVERRQRWKAKGVGARETQREKEGCALTVGIHERSPPGGLACERTLCSSLSTPCLPPSFSFSPLTYRLIFFTRARGRRAPYIRLPGCHAQPQNPCKTGRAERT